MKKLLFALCAALVAQTTTAQIDDPVVMTVNGTDVHRSEFEYSFNKNNTDMVVDKKSLDEYVELFVNYKLKVAAAKDAQLDTMASFQKEVADYRAQQAEEYLIDWDFIEAEARKTYEATARNIGPDGMFKAAHILVRLNQQATIEEQVAAKVRIDSIYAALKDGADFGELAKKLSLQQTHTLTSSPIFSHTHSLCCSSIATASFDTRMKGSGVESKRGSPARAHIDREGDKYVIHSMGGALCLLY